MKTQLLLNTTFFTIIMLHFPSYIYQTLLRILVIILIGYLIAASDSRYIVKYIVKVVTLATLPRDLGRQLMVLLTFEKRCEGPMHQSG